jgi:hypothetical protein
MKSNTHVVGTSNKWLWAERVVSALPALRLLFSAIMKLMKPPAVLQGFTHFGYPQNLIVVIALLELGSTIVYLIPRVSVLSAILMTGYLGGATATNVRIGDPSFVITVTLGVLVWFGLYLRDERLRALIPLRNRRA